MRNWIHNMGSASIVFALLAAAGRVTAAEVKIFNVANDVTREFFSAPNTKLFANVPDFGISAILPSFENEAAEQRQNFAADALEVVVPPASFLAETSVGRLNRALEQQHSQDAAWAFLGFFEGAIRAEIILPSHKSTGAAASFC
jgi:ABC-type sulfate transport system substrate-binding protein